MPTLIADPFSSVIQGILQGVQLRNQMQHEADTHDAMQRQALQQARENRIQDIQQRMLMQSNSRPVASDGTVTEQGNPITADLGNGVTSSTPMSIQRKADPSRTVTVQDFDGQSYRRELLNPDEQIQQQATQRATLARAGQSDISSLVQRMLSQASPSPTVDPSTGSVTNGASMGPAAGTVGAPQPSQFPGGLYVNPGQIPGILGDFVRGQNNERTNQTKEDAANKKVTNTFINNEGHKIQVHTDGSTEDLGLAQTPAPKPKLVKDDKGRWNLVYPDGSVKPTLLQGSVKPAGGAGRQLTPDAQALDERARQRQQASDQATVDKLQQQEQTLHGLRANLGDAIAAADGTTIANPLDPTGKTKSAVNALTRALWKNKLDQATKQVAGLQATQTRLVSKWGGQQGTQPPGGTTTQPAAGQPTAAPAQTAAPAATRPRSVDAKGNTLEFDGKAWVPVKP